MASYLAGLSDNVFGPPTMHQNPSDSSDLAGNLEAHMVLTGAVKELLERTGKLSSRKSPDHRKASLSG